EGLIGRKLSAGQGLHPAAAAIARAGAKEEKKSSGQKETATTATTRQVRHRALHPSSGKRDLLKEPYCRPSRRGDTGSPASREPGSAISEVTEITREPLCGLPRRSGRNPLTPRPPVRYLTGPA